jgi:hypothetical protein
MSQFPISARQIEFDHMWRVTIRASLNGSIGQKHNIRRSYEITCRESQITETAIARAYEDGDIEHVLVISWEVIA